MNEEIILDVNEGLGFQHIYYVKDHEVSSPERVEMGNAINQLIKACYDKGIYNVHIIGSKLYVEGLAEELMTEEVTKYSTNKIKVKVN